MALFSLTYDLVKSRDYQKLYDELDRLGAIRATESQFFFKNSTHSAKELRDHFSKFIDSDDRLVLVRVAHLDGVNQWAGLRMIDSPNSL